MPLTEPQRKEIEQALLLTWDCIGCDWLDLFPNDRCDGRAVQEGVIDADRLEQFAGQQHPEVIKTFKALPREEQQTILDEIFPPTRIYTR